MPGTLIGCSVRAMFDPRAFEKALAKRNEEAAESFTRFSEDLASGALDPKAQAFNQGAYELAPKPPSAEQGEGDKGEPWGGAARLDMM